jgi:nucleoside-diphosphate-sugar epimerase
VAGISFQEHKANIPGTGKELLSVTSREDIGRFVAAILKQPDITKDTIIRIAGDTVTANSLVEKYEKQLGKKFDVSYRPADEIDRIAQEGLKTGNPVAYFKNRIPLFTGTGVISAPLDCADSFLEGPT